MEDDAKKLANALMLVHQKLSESAHELWVRVHGLEVWDCSGCGHGGLGAELEVDSEGAPMCPWCDSNEVKARVHDEDVPEASESREAIVPESEEHEAFFSGEFSAWLESMQADGYATDDIVKVVKADCDALIKR